MNEQKDADDIRNSLRQLLFVVTEMATGTLAETFARHADSPPYVYANSIDMWFSGDDSRENMAICARAIRRHFHVTETEKDASGNTFRMEMSIPNTPFYFTLHTNRQNVCKRIDTGKTETKLVIDYSAAPTVEKEMPVIEWECDPILNS